MRKIIFFLSIFAVIAFGCNKKEQQSEQNQPNDNVIVVKSPVEERTGDELRIVAIMKVKPEAMKDIMPIFQAIVQGSQEEEGCISYNLHQDINDPTTFIMLEEWQSQDAIDFHNATDHYKAFKEASKELIESSEVKVLKLVY